MSDDRDLEQRFEELRANDLRSTPRFQPHATRVRRFVPIRFAFAAVALVVVAIGILFALPRPRVDFDAGDETVMRTVSAWNAPTDFLLKTPGSEMLSTTPTIPDVPMIVVKGLPQ